MNTILVVGGSKADSRSLKGGRRGVTVLHHDAYVKTKTGQRQLKGLVREATHIVVMVDACSHQGMWSARTLAKKMGIPIHYNRGLSIREFLREAIGAFVC